MIRYRFISFLVKYWPLYLIKKSTNIRYILLNNANITLVFIFKKKNFGIVLIKIIELTFFPLAALDKGLMVELARSRFVGLNGYLN